MAHNPSPEAISRDARWTIFLLSLVGMFNYIDRSILNTLGQMVKADLMLSDMQLGLLGGAAFAMFNGLMSIPIARLADRHNRVRIIGWALAFWSAMTAVCGLAQNFMQLCLARIAVGAGEAGGGAPSIALLSDHVPPHRRASAISLYALGVPLGILFGATASGWLAEQYGWRTAFVVVGAPGVVLALLVLFTLNEPREKPGNATPSEVPHFRQVLRRLLGWRSFRHMVLGAGLANFGITGLTQFLHAFFVRSHDLGYSDAATYFGLVAGVSSGLGFAFGGFVTDKLAKRSSRAYALLPGLCLAAATPMYLLGLSLSFGWAMLLIMTVAGTLVSTYFGPTLAVTQNLAEPRMRATATALFALVINLLGGALGGLFVGVLSDLFAGTALAPELIQACSENPTANACVSASKFGLHLALLANCFVFLWAAFHYILASRSLAADLAAAGTPSIHLAQTRKERQ